MKCRNKKTNRYTRRVAVALLPIALAGCSTTYVVTERANQCNINCGVPYFLPKRLAKVTVTKIENGRYDAHLNDLPPVADPCQAYVAIPIKHWYRSDVIDIRTSPDGLLSSAYITGERRNAGIQDNIRLSTVFFNKEGQKDELNRALHFTEDAETAAVAGREQGIVVFEAAFDPGSRPDVDKLNASLKKYRMTLEVPIQDTVGPVQPQIDRITGLVFRPAVQRPCYVKSTKDDEKVIASLVGTSPDQAPLFNLPLQGGVLAHHSHNLEMREGAVTGYYTRQPSEIAGLFKQSQELVEDAGSVVAAAIAPVAAALDVKRTAENQADAGTASEGPQRVALSVEQQQAIEEQRLRTDEQLKAQDAKIQQILDTLQQQPVEAVPAEAAVSSQNLEDVLPAKKAVAKSSKSESTPDVEVAAAAMPVRSSKSTAKASKPVVESSSTQTPVVAPAAEEITAVPAFDPITNAAPATAAARPSFFSRVRNIVPVGHEPAAQPEPATSAGPANSIASGTRRFFGRVKDAAPSVPLVNPANPTSGELSDYASGSSPGYTSPVGGSNLNTEAAIQFANSAQGNSATAASAAAPGPASPNVQRPSLLSRIKSAFPARQNPSADSGTPSAMTSDTSLTPPSAEPVANNLTPDLAALPVRSTIAAATTVPPSM